MFKGDIGLNVQPSFRNGEFPCICVQGCGVAGIDKPGLRTEFLASEKPELGQEMASEGEALVQAFKSGQVFYTLVAWKAVPEINGNEPKIVKQALTRS